MFIKFKKVIMSTIGENDYIKLRNRIKNEDIQIDKLKYVPEYNRYDILMTVSKAQAHILLSLTKEYNAILWKGEP